MPSIKIDNFGGGLNTQLAPRLLALNEAVQADGCGLENGAIRPQASPASVGAVPAGTKSLHRFAGAWETSTGERWWAEMAGRLYWADSSTDGGVPQKKVGGTKYRLGVAAPVLSTAPTVVYAKTLTEAKAARVAPPSDASYAITYYASATGSESAPAYLDVRADSGASLYADIGSADTTIKIKAWDGFTSPGPFWDFLAGGGGIVKIGDELITFTDDGGPTGLIDGSLVYHTLRGCVRGVNGTTAEAHVANERLYCYINSIAPLVPARTDTQVTGARVYKLSAGEYRRMAEVSSPTVPMNVSDNVENVDLGPLMDSEDNGLPMNLAGLCGPYNGMLVGWKDRSIYFSRSGYPDAWPADATFDFPGAVAACVIWGGQVVVLTANGVYSISGYAHDGLRMAEAQGSIGTTYGRTAVACSRGVLFVARNEGVVLFDGLRTEVISRNKLAGSGGMFSDGLMASACAVLHQDKYLLYYSYGVLVGDFRFGAAVWTTYQQPGVAGVAVSRDDLGVYLAIGSSLYKWASGAPGSWVYETGTLSPSLSRAVPLHTVRVAYAGQVTVQLVKKSHNGGVELPRTIFTGDTGVFGGVVNARIRVPTPNRYPDFSVVLSGGGAVYGLELEYS